VADGPEPGGAAAGQSGVDVADSESDVVEAGSAAIQKAADGRVGVGRLEQLEAYAAELEERDPDLLRIDDLAAGDGPAEDRAEERFGRCEVGDGDGHVIETGLGIHDREPHGAGARCMRTAVTGAAE
jgi:hypothetical protein